MKEYIEAKSNSRKLTTHGNNFLSGKNKFVLLFTIYENSSENVNILKH